MFILLYVNLSPLTSDKMPDYLMLYVPFYRAGGGVPA
jgi:hypothetical protein